MEFSEDESDHGDYLEYHESDDDQMEDVQSTSDNFIVEPSNDQGKKNVEVYNGNMKTENFSSLHKPPTNEEIQGLKETTDLYKSNLFKLQVTYKSILILFYNNPM